MSEIDQLIIEFLRIIADQTRLDILRLLKEGEKTSGELRESLNKSHSTISQHLKILSEKGLINVNINKILIEMDKAKGPGKVEMPKNVKFYSFKDQKLFDVLAKIKSFVIDINRDKLKDLRDLDVFDTLL